MVKRLSYLFCEFGSYCLFGKFGCGLLRVALYLFSLQIIWLWLIVGDFEFALCLVFALFVICVVDDVLFRYCLVYGMMFCDLHVILYDCLWVVWELGLLLWFRLAGLCFLS